MNQQYNCDVLIIGSGAAGLTLALHLAQNSDVIILSKGNDERRLHFLRTRWSSRSF